MDKRFPLKDGPTVSPGARLDLWRISSKSLEVLCEHGTVTTEGSFKVEERGDFRYHGIGTLYGLRLNALKDAVIQELNVLNVIVVLRPTDKHDDPPLCPNCHVAHLPDQNTLCCL